jgi:mono/diheme cytochrome c family protein
MLTRNIICVGIVTIAGGICLTSICDVDSRAESVEVSRPSGSTESAAESRADEQAIAVEEPLERSASESDQDELLRLEGERLRWASSAFAAKCALCHDEDGRATSLDNLRADLVDKAWHHGSHLIQIEETIREGVPDTPMKPQGKNYTAAEIADLAKYVKLLSQRMHVELAGSERKAATELTDTVAAQLPPGPSQQFREKENFIDDYIFGKMKAHGIPHAPLSTDAEFMRRLHLDLWGRLPDTDAVRQFVADAEPDKRNNLIDQLLGLDFMDPDKSGFAGNQDNDYRGPWLVKKPFLNKWTFFFSDLFRIGGGGTNSGPAFRDYIHLCLKYEIPYDYFVRELLTATAIGGKVSGPAGFIIRHKVGGIRDADVMHEDTCDEITLSVSKIFLGVNLECVSCHDGADHLENINLGLSRITRREFWQQAAFFENIRIFRGDPPNGIDYVLLDGPSLRPERIWQGGIAHFKFSSPTTAAGGLGYRMEAPSVIRIPRDQNENVHPQYFMNGERPAQGTNPRHELARMLTSDFQFAKATVNLFWSKLMTVGIVDPPFEWDLDRQDPENPPPAPWTIQPSHPELLDALARDFQDHNFELRYLMRTICRSKAYQLSSRFSGEYKPEYDRYYARKLVRRLSAEEIYDAIVKATNVFGNNVKFVMEQDGLPDAELKRFLSFFGQSNRATTQPDTKGSIIQASLILNSELVNKKLLASTEGSRVNMLLKKDPPLNNHELVEELFLATLSRFPTAREMAESVSHVEKYRNQGVEDLQWALMNNLEFIVNY